MYEITRLLEKIYGVLMVILVMMGAITGAIIAIITTR